MLYDDLLIEYRESKKVILNKIKQYKKIESETAKLKVYQESLKDIDFIIDWLTHGHEPENHRRIVSAQCYLIDGQTLEKVASKSIYIKINVIDYDQILNKKRFKKIFQKVTNRELECFLMVKCEKMKYRECGELLNIKVGTVQNYINRTKLKIEKALEELNEKIWINVIKNYCMVE